MIILTRLLRYLLVPWRAGKKWAGDSCTTYAAALAYYSAFSLAPILVIAVSVAGLVFGEQAVSGRIVAELESMIGPDGAQLIQRMIAASHDSGQGGMATVIGVGAMLIGATGLFMQMANAFEAIFGPRASNRSAFIKQLRLRLRGLTIIIGVGFLLMVSLVASTAIAAFSEYATRGFEALLWLATLLQIGITLILTATMIAILYRLLVPQKLNHRALVIGAVSTALLFELGKWGIGVYMGRSNVSATFGAAGSLAIVLIWVYYVSLIMLYGAELTLQIDRIERVGGRVIRKPRRRKKEKEAAAAPASEDADTPVLLMPSGEDAMAHAPARKSTAT